MSKLRPTSKLQQYALFTVLLGLACLLTACSHYQLAGESTLPFKSIYVEPVRNQSFAPQAQALLTQQTINAFLRDGTLRVGSAQDANAQLSIKLTDYQRIASTTREDDTRLAESFALKLTCEVSLIDNRTGKVYFKGRTLEAYQDILIEGGFQNSEYQSMPELTRQLSIKIRDLVTNTW